MGSHDAGRSTIDAVRSIRVLDGHMPQVKKVLFVINIGNVH